MTDKDRLHLLTKKYWTAKQTAEMCDISLSTAQKLRKKIAYKYKDAENLYSSRLIKSEYIIQEFFEDTREKQIELLLKRIKITSQYSYLNEGE